MSDSNYNSIKKRASFITSNTARQIKYTSGFELTNPEKSGSSGLQARMTKIIQDQQILLEDIQVENYNIKVNLLNYVESKIDLFICQRWTADQAR